MLNYSSKTFSTHRAWFGLEFVTSVWQSCIYWESVLTTRADTVLEVPSGIVGDSITLQWETSPGWVEVPDQAYRVGLSITYKVRDVHLFSENLHCRADWRLKDEFLKKGWATHCHDYFSSPQWDFCLCSSFFLFRSSGKSQFVLPWSIAFCSPWKLWDHECAHSVMGRTTRGKRESNPQSALLSHLYKCVDLLFHREKSLTVAASDCFSARVESARKIKGCSVVSLQTFTEAPMFLYHQNSKFG